MLFKTNLNLNLNNMEDSESIHALAYFNLLKTASWVEINIKEVLKPLGLTHAQLNALHILMDNHPNPVSAYSVKKGILVSSPDVTRLLDRLVKKGCVNRKTCPLNRRKIDISLTKDGEIIFKKAQIAAKEALGNFFRNKISEDEASNLREILKKIRN